MSWKSPCETRLKRLMPSVDRVQLAVEWKSPRRFSPRESAIKVDDGVLTDVLAKGHGMQRSIVFALLQMLIKSQQSSRRVNSRRRHDRSLEALTRRPSIRMTQRLIFRV